MKELNSEDFNDEVSEGKVVVDFWAPWCGPCKVLGPNLEAASEEQDDVKFVKLNVDKEPGIASDHGVRSIPTLIFFQDGERVKSVTGAMSKDKINSLIGEVFN